MKLFTEEMSKIHYGVRIATCVVALLTNINLANAFTIDQSNTGFVPRVFQNVGDFYPIGQSFIASAPQLTFVDLSITPDLSAALTLQIRAGSIFGPILGASALVTVPAAPAPGFPPVPVLFSFQEPVHLTVGDQFVIAVIPENGESSGLVGSSGGPQSTYAGGDQILGGIAQPDNDLWFDEGSNVPEPSTYLLSLLGCSLFFVAGRKAAVHKS